jgi:hypothetical protein
MCNRTAQISLRNSLRMTTALSAAVLMWFAAVHAASTNKTADIDKLMSTYTDKLVSQSAVWVRPMPGTAKRISQLIAMKWRLSSIPQTGMRLAN